MGKELTALTPHSFQLDPQLKSDSIEVAELALSRLLLINDSQYPWLVLVPRIADISEIHQLSDVDQQQLIRESSALSAAMAMYFKADKMNIANLGNIVSQLHLHVIARFEHDPAWPAPVWGKHPAIAYDAEQLRQRLIEMQNLVSGIKETLT